MCIIWDRATEGQAESGRGAITTPLRHAPDDHELAHFAVFAILSPPSHLGAASPGACAPNNLLISVSPRGGLGASGRRSSARGPWGVVPRAPGHQPVREGA